MTNKRMSLVESVRFKSAMHEADAFNFKVVDMSNLNRMSIYHVVEDIPYDAFLIKLNSSSKEWRN